MSIKTYLGGSLLAASLLISVLPASAATPKERMHRQHARIEQGVDTGNLTRHEAQGLRRQHRRISNSIRMDRMMHGGHLTPRERARLHRRENRASGRIYRLKHNMKKR